MSVTLTVKLMLPAALGVPLIVTVPAAGLALTLAEVRPVLPPLKPLTVRLV